MKPAVLLAFWPAVSLAAIQPSSEAALRNAFHVFSAVHSAGKQWGSSVFPASLSLIPAEIPAGTLLYHGGPENGPPDEPEWLAFEPEHAENFAVRFAWDQQQQQHAGQGVKDQGQKVLSPTKPGKPKSGKRLDGYFSTFQARQDIQVLLLDGSSAASPIESCGVTDAQDLVIGKEKDDDDDDNDQGGGPPMAPSPRNLCETATSLGYRAIVRMEMGFEVIYCDFHDGALKHVSSVRELDGENRVGTKTGPRASWVRAAGSRYDGFGMNKLKLAYSSMVSFWLFDVDLGVDETLGLSRRNASIRHATDQQKEDIRTYALTELAKPAKFTVDWGTVTDNIVDAFAGRMRAIASGKLSFQEILDLAEGVTSKYYDAPPREGSDGSPELDWGCLSDAMTRATDAFLAPATFRREAWSVQDELIHESISRVVGDFLIPRFFRLWSQMVGADLDEKQQRHWVKQTSQDLRYDMEQFDWADWKREQPCADDELLYVPMFPFGAVEDANHPGCRSLAYLRDVGMGFWMDD